jgi:Periplasmic binding protein domain
MVNTSRSNARQALFSADGGADPPSSQPLAAPRCTNQALVLPSHSNVKAIIGLGQTPTSQALHDAGLTGVPAAGFDVDSEIINDIENGTLTATADQQPYQQGYMTVTEMAEVLKFGIVPVGDAQPLPCLHGLRPFCGHEPRDSGVRSPEGGDEHSGVDGPRRPGLIRRRPSSPGAPSVIKV